MRNVLQTLKRAFLFVGLGVVAVSAPAIAQDKELTTVRIAMSAAVLTPSYTYVTVPNSLGLWEREGLKAEITLGQGSTQVIQLLQSGQADIGIMNADPIVVARITHNLPVKAIAALDMLAGSPTATLPGSSLKSYADFAGKTIGVATLSSGTIPRFQVALRRVGIDPETGVTLIAVGSGAPAMEALRTGQVDALRLWSGAFIAMESEGMELAYIPPADWEAGLYSYVIVASEDAIANKPDLLAAALRTMARGSVFAATRPAAAVQAYWTQNPEAVPDADQNIAFDNTVRLIKSDVEAFKLSERDWGAQTLEGWTAIQQTLLDTGGITESADPSSFFTNAILERLGDYGAAEMKSDALSFPVTYGSKKY